MNDRPELAQTDYGDGIVGLCLARAPVNALSVSFLMDFAAILDDLASDTSVRAVVLSSSFKVFSAGIDLKKAIDFTPRDQAEMVDALNVAFLRQFAFPKPLVVAINGAAIAGGFFFVLTADYRVAGPRAKMGLAEIRVGVDFPVGPLELARATLCPNLLRRLMLTGHPIDAVQAHGAGIIDHIEQDEAIVLDRAIAAARDMATSPADTFASVKRQIRQPTITLIETAMAAGATGSTQNWFNPATRAAMQHMIGDT